jgi:GNAT superfamily N-acetyltransferase
VIEHSLRTLSARHDLHGFTSGDKSLDGFLRNEARKSQAAGKSQTHVWEAPDGETVLAYFTLMPTSVEASEVGRVGRRYRDEDAHPAVLIAKLALCEALRNQGIGSTLILDVLGKIVEAGDLIGGRFIIVDARNDKVFALYEGWDFTPVSGGYRLWMKTETARAALALSVDTGAISAVPARGA